MPEFFSSDGSLALQFLVIFGIIVVLMMAAYLLFRRIAGRGLSLSARAGSRARQPRLGIVDIYELDRQRQLILLRRDNVEHLLLVGGPNDVVVERNVQRGAGSRLPTETVMRPEPASDLPALASQPSGGAPAFPAPAFEMPVVVPPPLPGSTQAPELQAPRLDPSLFEPDADQPEPVAAETAEAAGLRARSNRFLRRTPPPLVAPKAEPASQRAPAPAEPPVFADAPPPVMAAREPRAVDPAVLSDMARQLESALMRPSSAVTRGPGPAQPAAPEPAAPPPEPVAPAPEPAAPAVDPVPTEPEPADPRPVQGADPIAARMAASPPPAAVQAQAAEPPPKPRPTPAPAAKPVPKPAAPAKPPAEPAPRKPEPDTGNNPFSVEEIEAEFARLLGRPIDKKG